MEILSLSLGHSSTTTGVPLPSIKNHQPNRRNIQLEIHIVASLARKRLCPDETEVLANRAQPPVMGFQKELL